MNQFLQYIYENKDANILDINDIYILCFFRETLLASLERYFIFDLSETIKTITKRP